jgi:hypothetical protein
MVAVSFFAAMIAEEACSAWKDVQLAKINAGYVKDETNEPQ